MLSVAEIEQRLYTVKPILMKRFHVSSIGYFGSYATGNQHQRSDVDLLVEFSKPIGWDFFTLERYLEELLGLRVDLVTPNALKERMKHKVLNQIRYCGIPPIVR